MPLELQLAPSTDPLDVLRQGCRIPVSTYRLQLSRAFTFQDAAAIAGYLEDLGITDVYLSPFLAASPGSTHGYDIVDHERLNPELGTEEDYAEFCTALAERRMGQLVDFVPNHMGVNPQTNRWWRDVLEYGPASTYAGFFDIDWDPLKPELKGKVLLPLLGDHYGMILEQGKLQLAYEAGGFSVVYEDMRVPVNLVTAVPVLKFGLDTLRARLGEHDADLHEYLSLTAMLEAASRQDEGVRQAVERVRERLALLLQRSPPLAAHLNQAVAGFTPSPDRPQNTDRLHALLETQHYRLAYWRTAGDEINYRRFFDVHMLAALRMEDPVVFAATHRRLLKLIAEGSVTGLRIDHPDGLFDPADYFRRLQQAIAAVRRARRSDSFGEASPNPRRACAEAGPGLSGSGNGHGASRAEEPPRVFYVVAEKILAAGETLPSVWPVFGTTGYDFLNHVNGLFVDGDHAKALAEVYDRFIGRRANFTDIVYEAKRLIMATAMMGELSALGHALNRLSETSRRFRDFTLNSLTSALREVAACLPVYRTYVSAGGWSESDRAMIKRAIADARRRNPAMESSIFSFLQDRLLPVPERLPGVDRREQYALAMRFQQYTAPVMAKGMEDTAFYRYHRLLSVNEVGGDPRHVGHSPEAFHHANLRRAERWPYTMITTATHDTKRGEDARARINVLSELPQEWARAVSSWARINASHRTIVENEWAPDANDEYLFYQALIGAWPAGATGQPAEAFVARMAGYMRKATKEAKIRTSWIAEHPAYDQAVDRFVRETLAGSRAEWFLSRFDAFHRRVVRLGMVNSLAQLVLKIASPGVADFYQGTEGWGLSLVDPDNRRAVPFASLARSLSELKAAHAGAPVELAARLLKQWEDGLVKLHLTHLGLQFRKRHADLVLRGEYLPLSAAGALRAHVCAFARRWKGRWIIAAVPRLMARRAHDDLPVGERAWGATTLTLPAEAPAQWRHALTGELVGAHAGAGSRLRLAELFAHWPVALLEQA